MISLTVNGKPQQIDVPVFGGKVKSFDATATKSVKGVKQVVQVSNGVAVVADSFWAALQVARRSR